MTDEALRGIADEYARDLDAEVALLETVSRLAFRQREAAERQDLDGLTAASVERDRMMKTLAALEARQQTLRRMLADRLEEAQHLSAFESIRALHRRAELAIAEILVHDAGTGRVLEAAEKAGRSTALTLETGEATLAAYRKALDASAPRSGIVDRHG
jgi:hypothetical protein